MYPPTRKSICFPWRTCGWHLKKGPSLMPGSLTLFKLQQSSTPVSSFQSSCILCTLRSPHRSEGSRQNPDLSLYSSPSSSNHSTQYAQNCLLNSLQWNIFKSYPPTSHHILIVTKEKTKVGYKETLGITCYNKKWINTLYKISCDKNFFLLILLCILNEHI